MLFCKVLRTAGIGKFVLLLFPQPSLSVNPLFLSLSLSYSFSVVEIFSQEVDILEHLRSFSSKFQLNCTQTVQSATDIGNHCTCKMVSTCTTVTDLYV